MYLSRKHKAETQVPWKRYAEETEYELPEFREVWKEKKIINYGKIGSIIRKIRQCENI